MNQDFIQQNFCNQEISILFEALGFDEPCIATWKDDQFYPVYQNMLNKDFSTVKNQMLSTGVAAPLYQQAIAWINAKTDIPGTLVHQDGLHANFMDVATIQSDIEACIEFLKSQTT